MPITKSAKSGKASSRKASSGVPVAACPVETAINIIGGKWKLLVLRSLILNGPQGYNRLLLSVTGISAKELTRNLSVLADSGLVLRSVSTASTAPRKAQYELTQSGKGLMPTFESLLAWGQSLSSPESTNIPVR
jgi:DNA-binding HxlR family transcriptional regulator